MLGLFLVFVVTLFPGCATPQAVTLSQLATTPELYRNKTVEFSGMVKESSYQANGKGRLDLTLTDGTQEAYCYKESHNKRVISRAARLAEKAKKEEGQISVIGKAHAQGSRTYLGLKILKYKGESVDLSLTNYNYGHPYNWSAPLLHPYRHHYHRPRRPCD